MSKAFWRQAPLLGGLVDCRRSDYWNAVQEVSISLLWSLMPFWLGTFVVWIIGASVDFWALSSALLASVGNGELFIYTTALMAPILWMALYEPPGFGGFPTKRTHTVLVSLISVFAAVAFGLQKAGQHLNPTLAFQVSLILFCSSIFLLFLATVYQHRRLPDPTNEFRNQEIDFEREYRRHRE